MPLFSGIELNGNSVCNVVAIWIAVTLQLQICDVLPLMYIDVGFISVRNDEIVALLR